MGQTSTRHTPRRAAAGRQPKRKIAILGGGVGGMTAAFELTERPGWQDEYEITVYQMGWRLGGKGASGRRAPDARIEEHGLHVWFGFYDNAFDLIQRCYTALRRPPEAPLATWDQAFTPHHYVVLEEHLGRRWIHFPMPFPQKDSVPGRSRAPLNVWETLLGILDWMVDVLERKVHLSPVHPGSELLAGVETLRAEFPWLARIGDAVGAGLEGIGARLMREVVRFARRLDPDPRTHPSWAHYVLLSLMRGPIQFWRAVGALAARDDDARRLWMAIDMSAAIVRGMLSDGVLQHGFDVIDDQDLIDWLRKHGAAESTLTGAWVRAGYDQAFAFIGGDVRQPHAAAGTALRATLRMLLEYKGAFMWKMTAGMGDVIFAPLYEVLRRRNVRFEFFHRVKRLHLSADRQSIARITMGRQATLTPDYAARGYQPLIDVKGLPCWPSAPRYEQLLEGAQLQARGSEPTEYINLESAWSSWPDVAEVCLEKGKDFDEVILAIPPFSDVDPICKELIDARREWQDMVTHIKTARTQAFQLWLKPTLEDLGWPLESPILSTYVEPLDTWADMTHLAGVEDWPGTNRPGTIAYFCGPMRDTPGREPRAHPNPEFPKARHDEVKAEAIAFLDRHARFLWPNAATKDGFNWDLLIDPAARRGPARFDSQFWVANIDPSERYVLSVPGSTKYRLKPGDCGFDNLYLAGDWTRSGLNVGCVEAAVMSGMQAAKAICKDAAEVHGATDFPVKRRRRRKR